MYEGSSDNTGSTDEAKLQNCFEACRDKKTPLSSGSWTNFDAKGFILKSDGRCFCESAESTTPEQMSGDTCADSSSEPGCQRYDCYWKRYDLVLVTGSSGACLACGIGTYSTATEATSISACTSCGVGFTTAATGSTSVDQCICGVSFYLSDGSCVSCGAGFTTEGTNSTSINQCICEVSFYLDDGSCELCPNGFTTSSSGSTSLDSCNVCATQLNEDGDICPVVPAGLQGAFDNANSEDDLLVAPGTLTASPENDSRNVLKFEDKPISVECSDRSGSACIIDGQSVRSALRIFYTLGKLTTLSYFTLQNGDPLTTAVSARGESGTKFCQTI